MAKLKKNVLARMADTVVRTAEAKERLRAAASAPLEETYALLQTSPAGLGEGEVRARRARFGENALPAQKKRGAALRLLLAFANPFTAILLALALVSACTDIFFAAAGERNYVTVGVILVMVGVSGVLRFVQETKSSAAAEKLAGMVGSTACAVRGGQAEEVPVSSLVPGDVVRLSAGDMIPADLRIVEARDLFISQSALTGESAPEEKSFRPAKEVGSLTGCACLAFMGTNVVSGTGVGIVAATGAETVFGQTARSLGKKPGKTAFERGVASVSHILIAFMLAMVPVVLNFMLVNTDLNRFVREEGIKKIKIAPVVVRLESDIDLVLAKQTVDITLENILEEQQYRKERKRELRRQSRQQKQQAE